MLRKLESVICCHTLGLGGAKGDLCDVVKASSAGFAELGNVIGGDWGQGRCRGD